MFQNNQLHFCICHSGLDPESRMKKMDSALPAPACAGVTFLSGDKLGGNDIGRMKYGYGC